MNPWLGDVLGEVWLNVPGICFQGSSRFSCVLEDSRDIEVPDGINDLLKSDGGLVVKYAQIITGKVRHES